MQKVVVLQVRLSNAPLAVTKLCPQIYPTRWRAIDEALVLANARRGQLAAHREGRSVLALFFFDVLSEEEDGPALLDGGGTGDDAELGVRCRRDPVAGAGQVERSGLRIERFSKESEELIQVSPLRGG